jgi:hypothetical protein
MLEIEPESHVNRDVSAVVNADIDIWPSTDIGTPDRNSLGKCGKSKGKLCLSKLAQASCDTS